LASDDFFHAKSVIGLDAQRILEHHNKLNDVLMTKQDMLHFFEENYAEMQACKRKS